jgi:tripartite-type tricarboxylate transporter receptor subunit TctC
MNRTIEHSERLFTFWIGIMGPAGMPKATVDRLNADINAVIAIPATQKQLIEMGGELNPGDAASFGRFVQDELKRYSDIVRISGAKLEQ